MLISEIINGGKKARKKKQINWILLKLKMFVLQSIASSEWKQSTECEYIAKHISDEK